MRKLFLFFVMLCALLGTQTASASISGGDKLYLNTGGSSYWNQGGAWFSVYLWSGSTYTTVKMTAVSGDADVYEVTVPSGTWDNCIFLRQKNTATTPGFGEDEGDIWNKTYDLTLSSTTNCYKITGWVSDTNYSNGSWTTYTPASTTPTSCYVVGYVNGKSWSCNDGVALTESSDGVFTGTITLAPVEGNGTFCVATELNSDWNTFNSNYRYGPSAGDQTVAQSGVASAMKQGELAWCVSNTGSYGITVNFNTNEMTLVYNGGSSDNLDDPDVPTVDLTKVNMPLKAADFANGKKHYFVVGTRMAEWRLQPEWELLDEDGDGTYTLNNRLVYTGKMGIAMVDNYTDYVNQRYSYFYENTYQKSGATFTVNLTKAGDDYTAIQYDDTNTHGQFTTEKTFRFEYTGDLNEDGIRQSTPTLVGAMTLTVNTDGTPTKFEMSGISTAAADIAQYRTFSLVGSGIIFDGANWSTATPLQNQSGYTTKDWQESWIQYDELGMPYVDAHGNTIYQTVFQMDWLQNHPTLFRASDGFEYNSVNMVMSYNSARTHATTIPADGETAYWYNGTQNTGSRDGSWQCFELENMWMQGEFKVWTGWGGANKYHDGSNTNKSDARWNYDNGGHEKEGADWSITAADNVYYMTKRDINGADYKLDKRIFARYVRLWWDPSEGFDNSLIQLIVEEGGPQISCARNGKHSLAYTYSIPSDPNGQLQNYYVKNITITRYHVGTDDVVTEAQVSSTDYADGAYAATNLLTATTVNDDYYAEGGYYWYGIEVTYYPNSTAGYSEAFTRDAKSNQVFIYYATIPTGVTVKQVTETNTNNETLYSFDLAINGGAPVTLIGQKIENTETEVLSLVKYYVVAVPKYAASTTYRLFTSVEGATEITEAYGTQLTYDFANYHYFVVEPTGDYYQMPTITLKNVIPGDYTVKVDMVAADGDEAAWAVYNVSTASASVKMVKPATMFSAESVGVERIAEGVALAAGDDASVKPYGSKDAAVTYTQANKVVADGKFDQLMVTNGVLEDWEVKYNVTLEYVDPTEADNTATKTFKYYSAFNDYNFAKKTVALNGGDLTATLEYLPLATATADQTFTGADNFTIGTLSLTQPSQGYELKVSTRVDYTRRDLTQDTGKSSDMIAAETKASTAMVAPEGAFAAYTNPTFDEGGKTYQVWGGWDGTNVSYYYDAFARLSVDVDDSERLYRVAGFYAKNSTWAEAPEHECEKSHSEGGEAIGGEGYSAYYTLEGYEPSDPTKNHAAAASAVGELPFTVHYAAKAASSTSTDSEAADAIGTMYVVVTADYPIQVKEQPTLSVDTESMARAATTTSFSCVVPESGRNAKSLQMVTYPTVINESFVGATTDIDDVVAAGDGEMRIYPNPAVDVVTVAGSAALGSVEIYSLDGRLVKVVEAEDYSATIEVGDLAKGTYVVRAGGKTERMIKM